jgi:opacity protein-like surface antigen
MITNMQNKGNKMKTKILVATLFSIAATGAFAQSQANKDSGFYAELGLAQAYYKESFGNINNTNGFLKAGYSNKKNVSAEVMGATNINSASFTYGTALINAKVSNAYGGYGKFSLPVNDDFSLFVRLGVTSARVDIASGYGSAWSSGSDFSYGAGAQFNFTKSVYGQVDYMSYYNKNNISIQAPSLSIGYRF